jgi:hypothetical protein
MIRDVRLYIRVLFFFCCLGMLYGQTPQRFGVSGTVRDAETNEILRAVSIRVEGVRTGTMTDRSGSYILRLPPGNYTLAFSMIGYTTERVPVSMTSDSLRLDVQLHPAVSLQQEVVVTAETPAVALMRKVIQRKRKQHDSLSTYQYMLYTKFVARTDTLTAGRSSGNSDTTIIVIFESYSKGWFSAPDKYFNEIIQRRQSDNVQPQTNLVAFGTNINAYDDYVTILGEEIATPFHTDALDFYDFSIEREYRNEAGSTIVRIALQPRGNRKLFTGTVDIDKEKLVPVSVHLQPNKAVQLPFEAALWYTQLFEVFDNKFVMPTGLRIESSMEADILWVISPRLDVQVETVAYDYTFNLPVDNELFEQRRVEVSEAAAVTDSGFWYNNAVLPLRPEEQKAYIDIHNLRENPDSLERNTFLDELMRPVTNAVATLSRRPFTGWQDIFRYNRVHGAYLGLGLIGEFTPALSGTVQGGYGFADKHWYAEGELRLALDDVGKYSLRLNAYDKLARRDNPYTITQPSITLMSLFLKNDYGDYYYARGGQAEMEVSFGQLRFVRRDVFVRPTRFSVVFRNEYHEPAFVNTDFAVFGSGPFRDNPAAFTGTLRSLGMEFNWNYHPERRFSGFGWQIKGEIAEPSLIPSDFRFRQLISTLVLHVPTLPLWTLELRLTGGWSYGDVPPQRFFSLESAASSIAGAGALRGLYVKEFYGDRFATASIEHNFGELIPGILRIPNLASFGIEFIVSGGVGWSQFSSRTLAYTGTRLPAANDTRERIYYEAGLGLNKILLLLRTDVTVRLSQVSPPRFFFTLGFAQF